jgi:hypothetical protein
VNSLRIVGPRLLVRNYALPEKIGSLYVPEAYQNIYDGQSFEVVAAGPRVAEVLCVVADLGETVIPGLSSDVEGEPLVLEPDDIIITKGLFKGSYSPELSAIYGCPVFFLDVVETKNERTVCALKCVWPSKHWKADATEAA